MDILIKNMEMPSCCMGCTFDKVTYTPRKIGKDTYSSYEWHECFVKKQDCTRIAKSGKKPKWCPLIPVPEHGRLIDADELLASDAIDWGGEAWNGIKTAPVVLERTT